MILLFRKGMRQPLLCFQSGACLRLQNIILPCDDLPKPLIGKGRGLALKMKSGILPRHNRSSVTAWNDQHPFRIARDQIPFPLSLCFLPILEADTESVHLCHPLHQFRRSLRLILIPNQEVDFSALPLL